MFSKAKLAFNKKLFNYKLFQKKTFSTKEVMKEMNLSRQDIKKINHLILEPWVKPGREKLVYY